MYTRGTTPSATVILLLIAALLVGCGREMPSTPGGTETPTQEQPSGTPPTPTPHAAGPTATPIVSPAVPTTPSDDTPSAPRGRPQIANGTLVTDRGTPLRGVYWSTDWGGELPAREALARIRDYGLNALHLYAERHDSGLPAGVYRDQVDTIDLGEATEFDRIILDWEDAFGLEYEIQVSNENQHWTPLVHIADGDGGADVLLVSASARYMRMCGIQRATEWGYSLYEIEIANTANP